MKPLNQIINMAEQTVSEASEYGQVVFLMRIGNKLIIREGATTTDGEYDGSEKLKKVSLELLNELYS